MLRKKYASVKIVNMNYILADINLIIMDFIYDYVDSKSAALYFVIKKLLFPNSHCRSASAANDLPTNIIHSPNGFNDIVGAQFIFIRFI